VTASPILRAMKRGARLRCPACGKGALFRRYVKVEPHCLSCGEDNGRHRVDDAASYFTVLLVGHVVIAPMLVMQTVWDAPLSLSLGISIPLVGLLTLGALPFIKGAVLGALSATDRRARAEAVVSQPAPPPAP